VTPTRVAAIDCGTNSIRLLIADIDGDTLTDVERRLEIVRLGQGVDRTGRLAPEAIERTRVVLAEYAESARGIAKIRMVATSATRDAENRDEFRSMVRETLGRDAEVISGNEEAALSYAGAVRSLPDAKSPALVVDIGGGSTEFVLGENGRATHQRSVNIGCVRMTERHLVGDPPTAQQIAAAELDIAAAIDTVREIVPVDRAATLIGVAGTVTTMAAIATNLPSYDPDRIHGTVLTGQTVHEVAERLLAMPHSERAALPVMHPGRVDVIGGGALILRVIVESLGADAVITSEHDILDGIAWSLVA
jgi:exopolyphosphatase / guanosine-5'-triphosphate,3'-diphosphate pyrophosphatase